MDNTTNNNTLSSTSKETQSENDDPLLVDSSQPVVNSSSNVGHTSTTLTSTSYGSQNQSGENISCEGKESRSVKTDAKDVSHEVTENKNVQNVSSEGKETQGVKTDAKDVSGEVTENKNVQNVSCAGEEILSVKTSVTDTRDVSNEGTENQDVKMKMTNSRDVLKKVDDGNTESNKDDKSNGGVPNSSTLSGKVRDMKDVPDKDTVSKDVSNEMNDNKGIENKTVSDKMNENKSMSDKVTENKAVANKMTENKSVPDKVTENKSVPDKVTENKSVSDKVTENKSVRDKVCENKSVRDKVTENKSVPDKVTENKSVPDKVCENKSVPDKVTVNIALSTGNNNTPKHKDLYDKMTCKTGTSKKTDNKDDPSDLTDMASSRQMENKSNDISVKDASNVLNENKNDSNRQIKIEGVWDGCGNKNTSSEISCNGNRTEKNQDQSCSANVLLNKISSESGSKRIIKVEEDENPLDFSATGKIKLEVQTKESCALNMHSNTTLLDDNLEKTCALDYTISALNRAQSVTEVSSTSSVNSDLEDASLSLNNNICSVIVSDSPCDSSSDKIQSKDPTISASKNVSAGSSSEVKINQCQKVSTETSTGQNKNVSNTLSVNQKSKSVLNDTSKILQNTDMLLKDTADLLSNTSDLLNERLTNSKKSVNNTNTCGIESTPDKGSTTISGVGNEVLYSSAEEYKSRHKIGSRRSSENVLTYNNPVIQPYLPTSPEKSSPKIVVKRKFCVDEIAEHLAKKRAVVSLGERVKDNSYSSGSDRSSMDSPVKGDKSGTNSPVSVEKSNKSSSPKSDSDGNKNKAVVSVKKRNNSGSKVESEKKTKFVKTKKKSPKLSKKSDVLSLPSRRIKREASLNASARVNIIYEKDVVSPKSRKHSSSSNSNNSSGGKSNSKASIKIYRSISTDSTSSKSSKPKYSRSKSVGGDSKTKRNENNSKSKVKVARKPYKSTSSDDGVKTKRKKTTVKESLPGKKARLWKNENEKSNKKQKVKITNDKEEKAKKRKSSAEPSEGSGKKVKSDTQKSARTHVTDKPKSDYTSSTGTPCVKCCQHTCPQQSRKYWNGKEDGGQTINEEEKLPDNSSSLPLDVTTPYPVQTVQLMEGSPFVVPHGHIGPCHACAAAQGGNLLSTSHSYTLSGIGSISQMMPYHQAYGGGYPVPFAPSSSTPLPHCACPSCYPPTTGVYYPQTSTPITHQPLQHEPCIVPPHPVHIANEETEIIDVVGGESDEDDKQSSLENVSPPIKFEKTKKKTSSGLDLIRKKKKKLIVVKKNAKENFTKTKVKKKVKKKINKDKKKMKKNVKPKVVKKPQYRKSVSKHGWEFEGHPETRKIMCHSVGSMVERSCYPCIRHIDGDVIHVRDCVLLRSGPRKSDIPYVAKVKAFWEDPISKEMMMSILWYYQPEHTEGGRKPHHLICELFASKHKDENCVACIEDKGYVLTYAEYCRFMAEQRRAETLFPPRHIVVPEALEEYPGKNKLPTAGVDPNTVYVCRQVYDFKLKRILKNPS